MSISPYAHNYFHQPSRKRAERQRKKNAAWGCVGVWFKVMVSVEFDMGVDNWCFNGYQTLLVWISAPAVIKQLLSDPPMILHDCENQKLKIMLETKHQYYPSDRVRGKKGWVRALGQALQNGADKAELCLIRRWGRAGRLIEPLGRAHK